MEPKSRKNIVDEKENTESTESTEDSGGEHYRRRHWGLWVAEWQARLIVVLRNIWCNCVSSVQVSSPCPVWSLLPSGSPAKLSSALAFALSPFVDCLCSQMRSSLLLETRAKACWRVCVLPRINIKNWLTDSVQSHLDVSLRLAVSFRPPHP